MNPRIVSQWPPAEISGAASFGVCTEQNYGSNTIYRVSGKKRYSPLCLVFQSTCVDFFETCHTCRLKNGKNDECKINAFAMLSNIDKAICVETYFSTKSFGQTRRLFIKKTGLGPQEVSPGTEKTPPSADG